MTLVRPHNPLAYSSSLCAYSKGFRYRSLFWRTNRRRVNLSYNFHKFAKLNTEVLGVSVDSHYSHLAWLQTEREAGGLGNLNYPLLSDLKKEISTAYNVLTEQGVALRGLFIIDMEGIIQYATINNLEFGRSIEETQYVQLNPEEVCPANWQPGDETIKIKD